jgi:hypothetical protein
MAEAIGDARVRAAAAGVGLLVMDSLAAIGDVAIIAAWLDGEVDSIAAAGAHVLLAFALAGCLVLVHRRATARLTCRLVMLLLLGPLGGISALIQHSSRLGRRDGSRLLHAASPVRPAAEFRRTSQSETVFAAIQQDRRPRPVRSRPGNFAEIFAGADLQPQQEAIAAISRRYHPHMLPGLMIALGSPIPAIRVQAAAAYAKLRETYAARAKVLLAADPAEVAEEAVATALARQCREVAQSGFLDEGAAGQLEDAAAALTRNLAERRRAASRSQAPRRGLLAEALQRFAYSALNEASPTTGRAA